MFIYVASSWREEALHSLVVAHLRSLGHEVYDYRNPPGREPFRWPSDMPQYVSAQEQQEFTDTPLARESYQGDLEALRRANVVVGVAPLGVSSAFELGHSLALCKPTALVWPSVARPELMLRRCCLFTDIDALSSWVIWHANLRDSD